MNTGASSSWINSKLSSVTSASAGLAVCEGAQSRWRTHNSNRPTTSLYTNVVRMMSAFPLSFRASSGFAEQTKSLSSLFNMPSSEYLREAVRGGKRACAERPHGVFVPTAFWQALAWKPSHGRIVWWRSWVKQSKFNAANYGNSILSHKLTKKSPVNGVGMHSWFKPTFWIFRDSSKRQSGLSAPFRVYLVPNKIAQMPLLQH